MKNKLYIKTWLLMILCIVTLSSSAQTIKIDGYTSSENVGDYPLFVVAPYDISVSSTSGSFDYVYIDDIQVAYNSSDYWSQYSFNAGNYADNKAHKLQLKRGSTNYGICYFSTDPNIEIDINELVFTINEGKAYVSGSLYSGIVEAIIPDTYTFDGNIYSVVGISNNAFREKSNLRTVVIPNSVTSIGNSAFYGCSGLTSVTIPQGVTSIGDSAFSGTSIRSLEFNAQNCTLCGSSGYPAFPNTIKTLTIGNNVSRIPNYFLYNGWNIERLSIPNSVITIGSSAFYNCDNIKSLIIGSGVLYIGNSSFNGKYIIPKVFWMCNTPPTGESNVKASQNYVANNEFSLSNQKVYPFLSSIFEVDNVVYVPVSPSDRTCDVIDCNYSPSSTEIRIDSTVNNKGIDLKVLEVNKYAFYKNPNITSLSISNAGNIGNYAFYDCDALESVVASNNGYIGDYAFYDCDVLESVVASNNGYIGESAFYDCDALITVTASNQGNIQEDAFRSCDNLMTIDLTSIGSIGSSAFRDCKSLETGLLNIQGNIGSYAFQDCSQLTSISLGSNVGTIGSYAFSGNTSLQEINIPNNITQIGSYAFSGNSQLNNVSLGEGISSLPERMFNKCSSLPSLVVPANINEIGNYAFAGCSSLSDVTIEENEVIEDTEDIPTSISFPNWTSTNHSNSSTSYEEYKFEVSSGDKLSFNYSVSSESGYDFLIIKLNNQEIVKESGNKSGSYSKTFESTQSVTLYLSYTKDSSGNDGNDQASVSDIWVNGSGNTVGYLVLGSNGSNPLFNDCPLDEVFIGRKLSYKTSSNYGYSPFYRNTNLRTVEITDAETQIYDNEFYGCSNLTTLKIGNGVKSIGNWAFSGCSSLDYFSAGYDVETIGEEAFSDCTALTEYYSYSIIPPVCGNQALDDINKWNCTLYVPAESADEYQVAPQWKDFFFVNEMEAVAVTDVILNVESVELQLGDTFQLQATIEPGNASDQTVSWTSSNPSTASVSENGLISALKEGTTIVTATCGDITATCTVTVLDDAGVESLLANPEINISAYSIEGILIKKDCTVNELKSLNKGIYIIVSGKERYKISI